MTIRKARRKKAEKPFHEAVTDLLFSAMANHEDFILTYEVNPVTEKKEFHVMSGRLVTPLMLENLKSQVALQLEDGSGHHIRNME
jgi:DNA-binding MurR/RpiR family transcriptional regulator